MKLYCGGFGIALIVLGAALVGLVSVKVMGPGNRVEKGEEAVIEAETGIPVDLSEIEKDVEGIFKK